MPCADGREEDSIPTKMAKKELAETTRLLCSILAEVEKLKSIHASPVLMPLFEVFDMPSMRIWWHTHKQQDVSRLARLLKPDTLKKLPTDVRNDIEQRVIDALKKAE